MPHKQNWFNTLNEALASEDLLDMWPFTRSISYGENARVRVKDHVIVIYRNTDGMYERPIHYNTV